MPFCDNCGTEVSENAEFCQKCWNNQQGWQTDRTIYFRVIFWFVGIMILIVLLSGWIFTVVAMAIEQGVVAGFVVASMVVALIFFAIFLKIPERLEFIKEKCMSYTLPVLQKETFTDSRDGKVYETIKISNQTWMAENLDYASEGSKYYDNNPSNYQKYGRLYDWFTAKKACPNGWHLPSKSEWEMLDNALGGFVGKKLKAQNGWDKGGNGTDEYGFSALPGGYGSLDGNFLDIGDKGYWWSANEENGNYAYNRSMSYLHEYAIWDSNSKDYLFSVRCVKDYEPARSWTNTSS